MQHLLLKTIMLHSISAISVSKILCSQYRQGPSDIVCACKSHRIDYLILVLDIDNSFCNPTYTTPTLIMGNHRYVLCSFGFSIKDEELNLFSLHRVTKLHKCPYKQVYLSKSTKCSTKTISTLLTSIL